MTADLNEMEARAQGLLAEHAYQEASELFYNAALRYSDKGQHDQARLCFASAASCVTMKTGGDTFSHAASLYKQAAREAEISGDWEYTALLYKQAAICYERDHEFLNFSECYFKSKESYRRFLKNCLFTRSAQRPAARTAGIEPGDRVRQCLSWMTLSLSSLLWGHGERPHRAVLFGVLLILFCAALYTQGGLVVGGRMIRPNLWQAVYFSVITFTTVGYGDFVPVGVNKIFVIIESFGGLFVIPIFITGLCRKYLRF